MNEDYRKERGKKEREEGIGEREREREKNEVKR